MFRAILVFFLASVVGLFIQARWIHSLMPTVIAPNIILVLVVYVALHWKSPMGVCGAFLLGLLGDFASAQYLGPNAAGCVMAFLLAMMISEKIYAERGLAVVLVTFACSLIRSATFLFMLFIYTGLNMFVRDMIQVSLWEAVLSGIIAPLIFRLLVIAREQGSVVASPAKQQYRWSLHT